MKSIENKVGEIIQLHNNFLEKMKNELEYSEINVFPKRKKAVTLSDVLSLRLRRFIFMYIAIIAVFFSASFLIVNSLADSKKSSQFVNLNSDIFKTNQKGGIVFALNEALK